LVLFSAFYEGYLYPRVLAYQPGEAIGAAARAADPAAELLPFLGVEPTNAIGFYAQRAVRQVDPGGLAAALKEGHAQTAVGTPDALHSLAAQGWRVEPLLRAPSFPTSRPTRAFLLAATRPSVIQELELARLTPP
jgi:hypothetical protein